MLEHLGERHTGLRGRSGASSRVRVCTHEDPAQTAPAGGVLNEQGEMATVLEVNLSSMNRTQTEPPGRDGELHRPRDGVVIGQRHRPIPKLECRRNELIGQGRAVQEGERRVAVKLGVHGERKFAPGEDARTGY